MYPVAEEFRVVQKSVGLPRDVIKAVKERAKLEQRSFSNLVTMALRAFLGAADKNDMEASANKHSNTSR